MGDFAGFEGEGEGAGVLESPADTLSAASLAAQGRVYCSLIASCAAMTQRSEKGEVRCQPK